MMSKGWECPKCGRVYAPHVEECKACNELKSGTGSTKDVKVDTSATTTGKPTVYIYHRKSDDPSPMWPIQ